jgi:eukaryotic-like serine/threonine-protein kinase
MTINGRFKLPIWILPLAIAGLVAVLGWWGDGRLRETIQAQLKAQLTATLNANVTALGIWTTNQTRLATALTEDSTVRNLASQILQEPVRGRREIQTRPEVQQFANDVRPRLGSLGYELAQLVNTNYMVVANSRRIQLGGHLPVSDAHTNKFAELFASGVPVIITPFKPNLLLQKRSGTNVFTQPRTDTLRNLDRPAANAGLLRRGDATMMQVAAPVRNSDGVIIGALAMIINPDKEFSHILSVARWGSSGETYAFDQAGLLISHSRFDEQLKKLGLLDATNSSSALNLRLDDPGGDLTSGFRVTNTENESHPLIQLVASAVDGGDEVNVIPSRDYRGVPVVGASCWLPQFGFGVATQIDADEAYRPLRVLQMVFVVLILFLLLCATGLFVFSYANLVWRRRLSEAELKLKQLGQYSLEEKIGEGGMGVVYRARHAILRRDTAVKLLLPESADAASIERFEREVRLTCQLTHPNTIQVYDYGHTPDGIFYYAMEYLSGLNLHELIARFGPQPESRVVYILGQVCDSLAEAHNLGLIHRDIKPANIFLCRRGGVADCVKVLDFGLIREYRAGHAEPVKNAGDNVIEGTPWFTPPEAITGSAPVDPRSDIYSLGALGYYLLTAQYIFDAVTVEEIHQKQLAAAPVSPTLRTTNPISPEMAEILWRCLEKEPNSRPQSAVDLRRLLLASPVAADWSGNAPVEWWEAYERQPVASIDANVADESTPMATVRIDLGSRIE